MKLLQLTLETSAANLALDEALLDTGESGGPPVLRLWEPHETCVVVGRSSRVAAEVNVEYCNDHGITIRRRASGGAAVVAGPGCLMYSIVMARGSAAAMPSIDQTHHRILDRMVAAILHLVAGVQQAGISDLVTSDNRKFSGNSLRIRRNHLLYHGTLLYDFPLELISRCLRSPPRQPAYREGRDHAAFVTNLPADSAALHRVIASEWRADDPLSDWPMEATHQLAEEKYARDEWNLRH